MKKKIRRGWTDQELDGWIDRFERDLFSHQESEEEQESFTPEGRTRLKRLLREFEAELAYQLSVSHGGPSR